VRIGGEAGGGRRSRRAVGFAANPYVAGTPRTVSPFAPFRLSPDDEAFIEMEVQVADDACLGRHTFTEWYEEPVTYTLLGIMRH